METGILVALVVANAMWVAISKYFGPTIALGFYALVLFLCWQRNHFQASFIIGVVGIGIHVYELIFQGIGKLGGLESGLFFINLISPIPLIYFSYKAYLETR